MNKTITFCGIIMLPLISEQIYALNTKQKNPNVIFIMADDLGIGDLGCYGQYRIKTPAIDALAKQGMKFTQHYSGSTVSAPSRCVLLTGKHTGHSYIRGNKGYKAEDGRSYDLNLADEEITVGENKQLAQDLKNKYFFNENLKRKSFYFGEKIPYEESFLSFVRLNSFSQLKLPEFNEFSVKDLTNYQRNNYSQKIIEYNGKRALELELFKGILQPNSSGKKQILSSEVRVEEEGIDYFSNRLVNIPRKKIILDIKPLPPNKPANFKGIVGDVAVNEKWSKTTGKIGEAITLNLTFYGEGNLELLDSLEIDGNNDFNIFQNLKDYKEEIRDKKYYNEKEFEIAFIPKKSGILKTPKITVPYFNTKTGKYETLTIQAKEIKVNGKGTTTEQSITQTKKEETKAKTPEIKKEEKISKNIKESINVEFLKAQKSKIKNPYKLAFGMIGILALIELIIIIFTLRKKRVK